MKKFFTLLLLLCAFVTSFAQWTPTSMQGEKIRNNTNAKDYFKLDLNELRAKLESAEETGPQAKPVEVLIPTLEGKIEKFAIYSLPVMVKSLADQYQLGSYVGVGISDPTKYIRFSVAPNDFQAMILHDGVYQFIEPANKSKNVYEVHPKTVDTGNKGFLCSMNEDILSQNQVNELYKKGKSFTNNPLNFAKSSDKKYRTMRLAISVTAEYTTYFGGVTGALTAINATMTRVNGVLEKDFALHLIVQNIPALIYTNATSDPYSGAAIGTDPANSNNAQGWNLQLQSTLNTVVGNGSYDIGHLFGASGGGGNAGCIGCVCIDPTTAIPKGKGSGYTSPGDGIPQGDNFDIDYVAHEIGHQLGANHTFSHNTENSGMNVEPGSGSTIMGYAGITGNTTDVQAHSDGYFHTVSITQVQTNLTNKTCDIETSVTNNPPVIAALPTYNIPKGTAFVLTGTVTDPENDPMTFTWEEVDTAGGVLINKTNLGTTNSGATFRSLVPSTGGATRYFPRLQSVLAGVLNNSTNNWEAVSTVPRTTNFALTVRDNNPAGNQQQTQRANQVIIVGNAGPFKLNSTTGYNNSPAAISWDPVGTTAAPYNVTNVKIDYTIDNGVTWTVLSASTPNDGTENFQFTGVTSGTVAKVRVSAINNVFYAIGSTTINAMTACTTAPPADIAVTGITPTQASVTWTMTAGATYILQYRKIGAAAWTTINPATTPTVLPALTNGSQYEVQIATICNAVTGAFSASTNFTTPGANYCIPTGGGSSTTYYLNNITTTLGSSNLSYTANSYQAYVDNSATTFSSFPSGSINVNLASSGGSTYYYYVWIDWNNDGDFLDTGETTLATTTYTATATAVINIPVTQALGNYRVRFSSSFIGANTSCGPAPYGNYVDFTLVVGTPPTCASPTNVTVTGVSTTTANISWTASVTPPANGYDVYYSTSNVPPTATTVPNVTGVMGTTTPITGLTTTTVYYVWVRAHCSATDQSFWTAGPSFMTTQIPATLPYSQPFTGPNDFGFSNGTQANKWVYGSATGNPANSIYVSNDNGVTNNYTMTTTSVVQAYRDFSIPTGTTLATFSYDWKSGGESSFDYFRVWLVPASFTPTAGTQITAGAGRIQVGGNLNLQPTWQTYFNPTLNISTFAGQTMRLVYEWRNDGSGGTNPAIAIDNINLLIPTCQVPTGLTFSAVTSTATTISWTAASPVPANGYQYYVSTVNTPPTVATVPTGATTATTAPLTGLTPNTTYYFWVRSKCAGTDVSLWMSGGSFTTGQIPATWPYVQPFNGPNDFTFVNGTHVNKWVYGSAAGNPANSIYISSDNGVTNTYDVAPLTTVQAYRDISVPAGTTNVTFSFDWRAVGQTTLDYFRVWVVPVSFVPTAGTQITAGAGRIQVGGTFNLQSTWQNYFNHTLNLSSFAGSTVRLVFEWRNNAGTGDNPPAAIDNINLSIPTCQVPTNLNFNTVTTTTANITWTAAVPVPANGYQYYVSTSSTPPVATTLPTGSATTLSAALAGLQANTTYYFWVRSVCGTGNNSFWMAGPSFTTNQIPATFPYQQPFTTGPVDFSFTNGTQTNKWAYGSAAGNPANAIYISNDNGTTNSYTITSTSVVHAYRDIIIPAGVPTATLKFDWRAVGESSFDYFRVWLVPVNYTPTAGTQITALANQRIQIGANFNQQSTWQNYVNLNVNLAPFSGIQTMRLVFEWRNDGSGGTQPPAAIDNVRLIRCSNVAPVVTINAITHNSAAVTWTQDPGDASYVLRWRVVGATAWSPLIPIPTATFPAATQTYNLTGLSPVTRYEVEVAAVCQTTQGTFSHNEFETKCDPTPPSSFVVNNITTNSAVVSWAPVLSATYILQYREVGSATWIPVNLTGTTYNLTGLTPYTTYEVQVASICSGATNPFTTPIVFTTLPTCEMAPIGLTVTNLTMTSAEVNWNAFAGATYVLKWRKVGHPTFTTVNLNVNTYLLTGLLEATQYEVQVANVCGGTLQAFTTPYIFTTPSVDYCPMIAGSSAEEHISNVKVNPAGGLPEMSNNSGATTYSSYIDNNLKTIRLIQGSTNNQISVSKTWAGTQYNEAVTVWIDFNRNSTFEVGERILTSPPNKTSPVTGTFTVPSNAFVSLTNDKYVVMRVVMQRDGSPISCVNFPNGEVEDYKVMISKSGTINALDPNTIFIYPNPVDDILNISKVSDGALYTIYNAAGQLISKGKIYGRKINVSNLERGVYVIDVDNNGETAQKKFIKN